MSKSDEVSGATIDEHLSKADPSSPAQGTAIEETKAPSSSPEEVTAPFPRVAPRQRKSSREKERRVKRLVSTMPWPRPGSSARLEAARHQANHEQQKIVLDTIRRLAESEARSQLIVETAPDAFIGFDLESRIVKWNAQATVIFGWTKEEALGNTLWETIIPPALHEVHRRRLDRLRQSEEAPPENYRFELYARHRDGHDFPVEVTSSGPIHTHAGQFFGAFVRDISKRKEREEELRRAKESAVAYARSLEILNGISRELSALLNTDELLMRIGELLSQLLEYHTFSILLVDGAGKNLLHRFSFSGSQVISKPDVPIDRGVTGFAARNRKPVVVGDVRDDARYIKFHEGTRSELSVPLIAKDKLIGVLDIENRTPHYFRESHVQAVVILASQLAIALDNAILYDRVSAQEKQLHQDLQFARKLQKQLLTDDLPQMRNAAVSTLSWPARIIGGDIFEFAHYRIQDLHVLILGDVTGKGAPAALYAALTSGIIRQAIRREPFPADTLKAVNDALMERPLESHFVALTFAVWNDVNRTLLIANSGLPRPVHFRRGRMEIIDAVGTPLGLLAGREYEEHRIEASPGDVFLFLTDGILEAANRDGEEFGYAGIEKALIGCESCTEIEIRNALASALSEHSNGVEAGDDQTVIVFKVQDFAAEQATQ